MKDNQKQRAYDEILYAELGSRYEPVYAIGLLIDEQRKTNELLWEVLAALRKAAREKEILR